ncbi:MAG: hypothetical protein ACRDZ9_00335 [Acidimicrobiales bacterium]
MTTGVAVLTGLVAAAVVWLGLRPVLAAPLFGRANHRGAVVPTGAGVVVPLAVLATEALAAAAAAGGVDRLEASVQARTLTLVLVVGLGLVGLVDDLAAGATDGRGFAGHLGALARGRLTTGGLKLAGGAALATVVTAPVSGGGLPLLVADALLVALAANLGNLLDRAPGRTIKVGTAAFVALGLATGFPDSLAGVGAATGAGLALAVPDLRERLMLGDAGANALGGALGLGVVLATSPATRLLALGVVAVLNLASEVVSFSRLIEGWAPLRALDRAGRRP